MKGKRIFTDEELEEMGTRTLDQVLEAIDAGDKDRAKELADIIVKGAVEVDTAVHGLRRRSELKMIMERCVEINRLENMADRVYRAAMAELFDDKTDFTQLIKWREIYEHMESATDRCEDVANVLEGVALKHA